MSHYRWTSLLGAVAVCAVSFAAEDEKGFVILMPSEIVYEKNPAGSGPDFAVVAGDPTKEGFYIIRARFAPGVMSHAALSSRRSPRHGDLGHVVGRQGRHVRSEQRRRRSAPAATCCIRPARCTYDGAKDVEAIVEIKGMGPAPSIPAAR